MEHAIVEKPPTDHQQPCKVGGMRIKVRLEAREPCPVHAPTGTPCTCMPVTDVRERDADLATKQFAQFVQTLLLNATPQTITDITSVGRSVANATATTAPTIAAGTGTNAAVVTDVAMQTQTETIAGTVNAYSGSGASGNFTVTGTITATANRAYAEVGLQVTNGGNNFLICHDSFSVLNVSNTGTLTVTYTLTFS